MEMSTVPNMKMILCTYSISMCDNTLILCSIPDKGYLDTMIVVLLRFTMTFPLNVSTFYSLFLLTDSHCK